MKSKRHFITVWAMCSFFLCVFIMPVGHSQAAEARSDEEYEQEIGRLEQALKECRDEACKKETLLKKADTHFYYGRALREKRQFEAVRWRSSERRRRLTAFTGLNMRHSV